MTCKKCNQPLDRKDEIAVAVSGKPTRFLCPGCAARLEEFFERPAVEAKFQPYLRRAK